MRVVFPTLFEEFSFKVLEELVKLKPCGLKEIHFLYVIEPEKVIVPKTGEILKSEVEKLRNKALSVFKKWETFLHERGIKAFYTVEIGKPVERILLKASQVKADLVVMGHRKRRGIFGIIFSSLGSNALTLIKITTFPVLVFPSTYDFRDRESIFERPLLALDLSKNSELVVEYLCRFSPLIKDAKIIHVLKDEPLELVKEKFKRLSLKFLNHSVSCSFEVFEGNPSDEIIKVAEREKRTLIAMGIIGRHEEERRRYNLFWFGSVAQKVTDDSDVPVLLVPPERKRIEPKEGED